MNQLIQWIIVILILAIAIWRLIAHTRRRPTCPKAPTKSPTKSPANPSTDPSRDPCAACPLSDTCHPQQS